MPTTRRALSLVALLSVSSACGGDAPPAALDTRPLALRMAAEEPPGSFVPPWSKNAAEASPATQWILDGDPVESTAIFVVGTVENVAEGFALGDPSGEPNIEGQSPTLRQNVLPFNGDGALSDVVIVELAVTDGVTGDGSPLPSEVRIALPLPPPTDLPSLRDELMGHGELAAIVFPAIGLAVEPDLYELFDSFLLGTVTGASVTFGELTGPSEYYRTETVAIATMLRGAGAIRLSSAATTAEGIPGRIDEERRGGD